MMISHVICTQLDIKVGHAQTTACVTRRYIYSIMEQRQKQGDAGDGMLAERIARVVHAHFDALPARSKPILRDDGTREWIPMCGVVVVRGLYILSLSLSKLFLDRKNYGWV